MQGMARPQCPLCASDKHIPPNRRRRPSRRIENVTRFTFKYVDARDWERKFSIVLDVSTSRYRAKACEPMLPNLAGLIDKLNEEGNFFAFIGALREAFVGLASNHRQ